MAVRSDFPDILEPGFRKIFNDAYKEKPTQYEKVFNVLSSTKQDERDSSVSGFGLFDEHSEKEALHYEDPVQGYDVRYVHKKYAKGFRVTEEAVDDDQYNVLKKKAAALGRAARRTIETKAANILNLGFGTTETTGGDGKALFAADHPLADSVSTQNNTDTAALAETALKNAYIAMQQTLDDKGQLVEVMPSKLVVPPALRDTAKILIESRGRTNTAYTNEVNPYENEFEVIVWAYLGGAVSNGSDTAWYLIDPDVSQLNFFWRKPLTFGQDNAFSTDEALYKAKMRFSVGFSDWRGVYGSTGAA